MNSSSSAAHQKSVRSWRWRTFALLVAVLLSIGLAIWHYLSKGDWFAVNEFDAIASGFAAVFEVNEIQPHEFMQRRAAVGPLLIVDVRQSVEQNVSIIPGAVLMSPRDRLAAQSDYQEFIARHAENPDALVVVYCAGGYRSARAISEVSDAPVSLLNLHGGIVAYANAGGKLIDPVDGQPVQKVHGYNAYWAGFVQPPNEGVSEPSVD
ncbi:MAG: hypothetical protein KDK34_18790 [Leptospiraceae bacterium]|nr:hypothetical protein [Leptospiraceae bacterium]